ncbi:DUF255 domain-containing protein [Microbacterium resistens]|uniref:DUF255 domain-containing protein n=3 Tax=Microbacterium TaxID=33882 RepID=A0ABY3RUY9_9MICO|nr:DUF255 domain-containing protein [Microbacterium resistens]UGS26753.1 DUF255 domain-containing protein [Microbacterium resistens]
MANRLAGSLSPYLRAHADNPVDWYPWGEEAFAEAERRDVPLLISIGYSTCHWCHVMARESFADPVTAAAIAAGFVAVKVDREEHPEVDAAYMAAASAFTQNLGWPLTVFTTPGGHAFYAGTYWPPTARAPLPAFRDVLGAVREAWALRRADVEASAGAVADALVRAAADAAAGDAPLPSAAALAEAARGIAAREDAVHGGFGGAPKFPVATALRFLQQPVVRREAPDAAGAAERALRAMSDSPLRDPVDGGFFRYATQRDWSVPHYERMLTDNAQLLDVARCSDAFAAGDESVARGIARFLLDVLRRPGAAGEHALSGGFGAAQDSESWIDGLRSEGGYYAFDAAGRAGLERPAVDAKVVTGWNGLAIGALARAGARMAEPTWIEAAAEAARFVLRVNRDADGRLVRTSTDGRAAAAVATRADLGLLADGLFALALATGEAEWAATARTVLSEAVSLGGDPVLSARGIGGTGDDSDGDLPSGASALAAAERTAWLLGAGEEHRARAEALVAERAGRALAQPFAHSATLAVAAGLAEPPRQIVVVADAPDGPLARAARAADADLVAVVTPAQARAFAEAGFALFDGKAVSPDAGGAGGVAFDCRSFVCRLPVSDPSAIARTR